jgi:ribosomal protein S18 acetylase RimI-like enzyme
MEYSIRLAEIADAEGIAVVHTRSWQTSYRGILPDAVLDAISVQDRLRRRQAILSRQTNMNWVAIAQGSQSIVGFCDAGRSRDNERPELGELYALYMLEEHKRFGVGRRLFDEARKTLKRARHAAMFVDVLKDNVPARAFYEKMGGHLYRVTTCEIGSVAYPEVTYDFAIE